MRTLHSESGYLTQTSANVRNTIISLGKLDLTLDAQVLGVPEMTSNQSGEWRVGRRSG